MLRIFILAVILFGTGASADNLVLDDGEYAWKLGSGTKFIAKQDIFIPGNVNQICVGGECIDEGDYDYYCSLSFQRSSRSRYLAKGSVLRLKTVDPDWINKHWTVFIIENFDGGQARMECRPQRPGAILRIGELKEILTEKFAVFQSEPTPIDMDNICR